MSADKNSENKIPTTIEQLFTRPDQGRKIKELIPDERPSAFEWVKRHKMKEFDKRPYFTGQRLAQVEVEIVPAFTLQELLYMANNYLVKTYEVTVDKYGNHSGNHGYRYERDFLLKVPRCAPDLADFFIDLLEGRP